MARFVSLLGVRAKHHNFLWQPNNDSQNSALRQIGEMMEQDCSGDAVQPRRMSNTNNQSATRRFLQGVFRSPFATGAIAPTSKKTADTVAAAAGVATARRIIELGAGTGVVTRAILAAKRPGVPVLAIERDPDFASSLEGLHPDLLVVNACASSLPEHAPASGFEHADCILCALPWSLIAPSQQAQILAAAKNLLTPGGIFLSLVCWGLHALPSGRRFHGQLRSFFPSVRRGPVLLSNLPPAIYYLCTKDAGPG